MTTDPTADPPPELDLPRVRDAMAYYDHWLAHQRRVHRVPGVQAAVRLGAEVVLSRAHGLADVEGQVALTPRHLFRVASHSKTFTATAVLQLARRGVLRLDDPAGRWVPFLTDAPLAVVTLRELLQHAGGVSRDSPDGDHWQLKVPFPDHDELRDKLLATDVAVLPRNDRFKYSNLGFSLLGLVIEAATGTTYADAVRAAVLEPLGLRDTGPELDPDRLPELAVGYSALAYADTRVPIEHVDTRAMAAATGFYSTARDLVDYFAAHFLGTGSTPDDRLLDDDSKRQMQSTAWAVGDEDRAYGLGLAVATVGRRRVVGHGGGYPGHITSSVADPRAGLAVSVLTNAIDGPAEALAHAGVRLIDLACATPRPASPGADVSHYTGRFASLWGVVDVVALGGRLFEIDPGEADPVARAVPLEIVDATSLRVAGGSGYGSYGELLHFEHAADGSVRSMRGESGVTHVPLDTFALPARVTAPPS